MRLAPTRGGPAGPPDDPCDGQLADGDPQPLRPARPDRLTEVAPHVIDRRRGVRLGDGGERDRRSSPIPPRDRAGYTSSGAEARGQGVERTMTERTKKLLEAVLSLPVEEQADFMDALAAHCHGVAGRELAQAWDEEVARRLDDIDSGRVQPIPRDQFFRALSRLDDDADAG